MLGKKLKTSTSLNLQNQTYSYTSEEVEQVLFRPGNKYNVIMENRILLEFGINVDEKACQINDKNRWYR